MIKDSKELQDSHYGKIIRLKQELVRRGDWTFLHVHEFDYFFEIYT